jgi:hypothetical protein
MTTSEFSQIPEVVDILVKERPQSVLDVGSGWGKYGVLAREYAEPAIVDAIDVMPPRYQVYDHAFVGDIRELDRVLPKEAGPYDLALLIEVIEHLEKSDAWELLDRLVRRAKRVLITTPLGFRPQDVPDMPFENHRSGWFPWQFSRYRIHRWKIYASHESRFLRIPKLWQMLVLISARDRQG